MQVVLASAADPREQDALCSVLDADDAVDAVLFAGNPEASKPAPDLVQMALSQAAAGPAQSVFVGDSVQDGEACQRA